MSHINCYYTCQFMKFFKFDFFEDFDLVKLIFTQKSNSKHHESIFMLVCVSTYSYFSISHINCYYTCQYMKFFKFNFNEEFDPPKLILTQNWNSKHLESTFMLVRVSGSYWDLRYMNEYFFEFPLQGLHPQILHGP